jgi:integrase
MSIQNIGRNLWRVVVKVGRKPDGSPHYINRRFHGTKAEALEYEASLSANQSQMSKMELGRWIEAIWLPSRDISDAMREDYRFGLRYIQPICHISLCDLTALDIEACIKLLPEGNKRVRARKVLSASLNAARRGKAIPANPLDDAVINIGHGETRAYDAYDINELNDVFAAFYGHVGEAVVLVMGSSGLRKEEALALHRRYIDLDTGAIHVRRAWARDGGHIIIKPTKTDKSTRDVYIAGKPLERLREIVGDGALWPGIKHEYIRPDAATRAFQRHIAKTGIRYIPIGGLRHSYATIALDAGINIAVVSKNLGHARISITYDRYVRIKDTACKDAALELAKLYH